MFSLQDLLDLPLMVSSRPQVLSGDNFAARPVRWVHTSEIFEISPLLKGGEVLFTTGLGLVGAPEGEITAYVDSLAAQNVTALVMEVGRTFVRLPDEFVEAARRHNLPLITMHQVVPFVEITETVHPILISDEVEMLRRRSHMIDQLTAALLAGAELADLTALTAATIGGSVGLYSPGGQLLAGEDVRAHLADDERTEVNVGPEPWALLATGDFGSEAAQIVSLAANAIALRMAQRAGGSPTRAVASVDLLADLVENRFQGPEDIATRAASLGFVINPARRSVGVAIDLSRAARTGVAAVTRAARRSFGPNLVAELEGRILVVFQAREHDSWEAQLHGFAATIERELADIKQGRLVRLVSGPFADSWPQIATSLQRADRGAGLALRLAIPERVVTERDLGIYDLLTRVVPDIELEAFVEQQLGPLLQSDARSGHRLMATLNAYLEAGRSKSAAAATLGVSRQTLYQRLDRISSLLGGTDLDARDSATAIDLAVTAWRIRTSGLTGGR